MHKANTVEWRTFKMEQVKKSAHVNFVKGIRSISWSSMWPRRKKYLLALELDVNKA